MPRPFNLKRFLRQTPLDLIEAYFEAAALPLGIDFSKLSAKDVDPIAAAIGDLDEQARLKVMNDFGEIEAIASERGMQALCDEANWQVQNDPSTFGVDRTLRERLSAMESDHARAMWIYIHRRKYWHGAMRFLQADTLSPSLWQKRKDLRKVEARVDKSARDELGQAIGSYFHQAHGRGRLCAVEIFRRGDCDYFYCFGQDASEAPHAWVDGQLGRMPLQRARDVIYVYNKNEGSLDTYARGGAREISALEAIFAEIILGQSDLQPVSKSKRVYKLDALKSADFPFQYDAASEILSVVVRQLRLSQQYGSRPHTIVQGDHAADPHSVYDELAACGDKISSRHVTQAEIGVKFTPTPAKQKRSVVAVLTHPNRCNLRYDGLDLVVRNMLKASGLEPEEQST